MIHLDRPWLVATWPGIGSVSVKAGRFLQQYLGATYLEEVPAEPFFEIDKIEVERGLAVSGGLPRNSFYGWKNPAGGPDLLLFIAEAQPSHHGFEYCRHMLDAASNFDVSRVYTFAAFGTQQHLAREPRVFAVANQRSLVDELAETAPVDILDGGQITGLNGVLLAAAVERSLPGIGLLGEMPVFASGIPNPKASLRVLEAFSSISGIELDLAPLRREAEAAQRGLFELLDKMTQAVQAAQQLRMDPEAAEFPPSELTEVSELPEVEDDDTVAGDAGLSAGQRNRIERLFARVGDDRDRAVELKGELDRLGVYEQYEDRFLDLFRTPGD
ncbi:MAG: PAC2 family protein [Planctomycetota bacterium]